ncbi:hypothetical protein Sjap_011424 [Stephania japonica]|uniref:GH18 domain-containing protein n=1 Tax=Stephania japonica TaxID=461633 RepID=A0AAP0JDH2_9MAGN
MGPKSVEPYTHMWEYKGGPLNFKSKEYDETLPCLVLAQYSWTKVANVIFLDTPVGSGYSYSGTQRGWQTSDSTLAEQTYTFLRKGYLLGNPGADWHAELNSIVKFVHAMNLISDELFELAKKQCNEEYIIVDPSNTKCLNAIKMIDKCISHINAYQVLEPHCPTEAIEPNLMSKLNSSGFGFLTVQPFPTQEHMGTINEWIRCNLDIPYKREFKNVVKFHQTLSTKGHRILIFSGDHDSRVPSFATEAWIKSLNFPVIDEWRPWFVEGQISGEGVMRYQCINLGNALRCLRDGFLIILSQDVVRAAYWFPDSGIESSNIDASLFTHLFCAFADINSQTNQVTVSPANIAPFSAFTRTLQQKNPSIKTLMSIGGGNTPRQYFSSMASSSTSRKAFIDSSINLARSFGFNGLDLDWEYPNNTSDMANLGILLVEWRNAVVAEARASGKPTLLLTAAFYYASKINSLSYPIQETGRSLDWINVMAYDMAPATGPVVGPGFSSRYGAIGFKQIKDFIQREKATEVYSESIGTNYCYAGAKWIGFDDYQSISAKVSYAKQNRLLGYFAWHVANDLNWLLSRTDLLMKVRLKLKSISGHNAYN